VAVSASARMRCLYSGREGPALGVGDNLGSGRGGAGGSGATVLPAAALRSASLRSASLRSAAGKTVGEGEANPLFFTLIPILALLSNYDQENCLINCWHGGYDGNYKHRGSVPEVSPHYADWRDPHAGRNPDLGDSIEMVESNP